MSSESARPRVTARSVVTIVVAAAMFGMILGGLFGAAAGWIAPGLFLDMALHDVEPIGAATVVGAFGGVMCGGALGGLAVVAEIVAMFATRRQS